MFRFVKFFSTVVSVIGGLVGLLLPLCFSIAQNYGPLESDLLGKSFRFIMPNESLFLYAITEPNTYTIHFDGNGNTSGEMDNMNMTYDVGVNLLANSFEKNGYIFQGWSRDRMGRVEFLDKSEIKNLTSENSGEIVLYAQWEAKKVAYTINYYLENIAGTGYVLDGTGMAYAIGDSAVILTGKLITGFTLQTGAEVSINEDGSSIVNYYYTRNAYNLTIKDRNKTIVESKVRYEDTIPLPSDPERTGNIFVGWNNLPESGNMPANNLVIDSKWEYGEHVIIFDTDGGTYLSPISGKYGSPIKVPSAPYKTGYEFVGWTPGLPSTIPYDDMVVKAIWKEINSSTSWSGGGGRRIKTNDSAHQIHKSADGTWIIGDNSEGFDKDEIYRIGTNGEKYTEELVNAYNWAKIEGITSMQTIEKAKVYDNITREQLAKMMVVYISDVLGKKPIRNDIPSYGDVSESSRGAEMLNYIQLAYQYQIMGIDYKGDQIRYFNPEGKVTRAEFATVLSRVLYGDKYNQSGEIYYGNHIKALFEAKILTNINPTIQELRGWIILMLYRSVR